MSRPRVSAARWRSTGSPSGSAAAASDEQPGVGRELEEALRVALLDLAGHRLAAGKPEPAGELGGVVPGPRQLEQRERVAVALGDDLVAHRRVERAVHVVEQQRPRVVVAEPVDGQLGEPGEDVVADCPVRAAHTIAIRSARRRRATKPSTWAEACVEPLRVVDDADERLLLGDLGEQRQRGQPDQEPVRRRAGAQSEHRGERVALRTGQAVEAIQHRRAELMEPAVGQLHLRLDAHGPRDVPARDPVGEVVQQGALADARLTPQDDDPAPAGERVGQEPVERFALAATSEELRGVDGDPGSWAASLYGSTTTHGRDQPRSVHLSTGGGQGSPAGGGLLLRRSGCRG